MPIVIKEYTLKVTKGTASAYSEIPADNYRYVILEHRHYSGSSASMLQMDYSAYSHKMSSGATRLYISQAKYDNESDNTYKLTVVGFLVNMTSDVRTAM